MTVETKIIDITPDKSLMPKIAFSGYTVVQAISELVDNSVDAKIDGEDLLVEINLSPEGVSVADNGKGMNEKEAANSLRLAHSEKKYQLGEFGLGLKTAAQSLGKKFTISTTPTGVDKKFVLVYDEDLWDVEKQDWKHPMQVSDGTDIDEHGTRILIEKLKIKYYPNIVTNLKGELGMRYAPLIEQGMVKIKVNTTFCEPHDQELTAEGKNEFNIKLTGGNKVYGWVGLLKNPGGAGNKGYYGFNTFRRGRLIAQYEKIGFNPHPTVRRIVGELHMDHVPVTHNKREWIKEHTLYREVEEAMAEFIKPLIIKARKYDESSKIDENVQEKMEQQLESIAKAINRTEELKQYSLPTMKTPSGAGAVQKMEMEIEQRDPSSEPVFQVHQEPETQKNRTPKKIHRKMSIKINGKKYKFKHVFQDLGDRITLKLVSFDMEKGIEVYTNTAFPAFSATRDYIFYGTLNVAEAIAECMVKEKNEPSDHMYELRNVILRETAQIMHDLDELDQIENEQKERQKKADELKRRISGEGT